MRENVPKNSVSIQIFNLKLQKIKMSKIIIILALISSSHAIFLQHAAWHDQNSGSIGPVLGIIFRPLDINVTEVVTGHNVLTYPHGRNYNNTGIIGFTSCSELKYIPKGIQKYWPSFIAFGFNGCGFEYLNSESFRGYENLQSLSFVKTKLHFLPSNLFTLIPMLKDFVAPQNQISIVGENIFRQVPLLEFVDLTNNVCINEFALTQDEIPALERALKIGCSVQTTSTTPETTTGPWRETTTGGCSKLGCKLFKLQ